MGRGLSLGARLEFPKTTEKKGGGWKVAFGIGGGINYRLGQS